MPSRKPSRVAARGAGAMRSTSTCPRGSNTRSYASLMSLSNSQIAGAVDADGRAVAAASFDAAQDRRRHVAPARDKGRETPGRAADDKEMDVVGARHDRDTRLQFALVPARQVAAVDAAVAMVEAQLAEQIPGVHVQVVAHIMPGPAFAGDRLRVLGADDDGAMPRRHRVVVGDRAHRGADAVEDALGVIGDMVCD